MSDDMKNAQCRITNNRGFSIMEMLIALFLTGIITTAVFQAFTTQQRHYAVQDDVTTIQQNARASIDELTRQIRMAGHDIPQSLVPLVASILVPTPAAAASGQKIKKPKK